MHTIEIEVFDKDDLQLIILLVKRLGLKFKLTEEKKDLEYHLKVIETGGTMTDEKVKEMLKSIDEDRQDREQTFREP